MKRLLALAAALLLLPLLVRLLLAQSPTPPPSQTPPPPPTFTLTDLGSLNGASGIDQLNVRTGPTALNGNAQVAGFRLNLAFGDQPIGFLWDKGTFTDLGTGGGPQSYAYGINTAGQIVGASNFVATSNFAGDLTGNSSRAFLWQNGVMTILDPDPNYWSRAYAINKGGDVAGFISNGGFFPVTWKPGVGRTMLASLPCSLVTCQGQALGINDLGQAAGWSVGGNVNVERPVMWDSNGQPTDLIPNPGYYAQANGIDNGGVVVGYYQPQGASGPIHAFSWQSRTLTDLGAVGSDTYSGAWGINTKGDIVGISAPNFSPILGGGGGRAFLRTGGVMYDVTTLLAPGTNWILDAAFAINDSGQVVGIGHTVGTIDEHGYLLTPIITPTTTTVSGSASTSVFGQQVSFTAAVTPTQSSALTPTGNVTFSDGGTVLGTAALSSGSATFSSSSLSVGAHTITASYAGDNNFGSSTSSAVGQVVNQAASLTALAMSPNPANVGQTVTFTATVTSVAPGTGTPTGTVKFLDGSTTLGTVVMNGAGNATFSSSSLALGSHSITAAYGGDANFAGSSSSSVNQVISQPATSTALAASPNPANVGQTITFTATVTVIAPGTGTPTGTVTFLDGATTLGTSVLSPLGTVTLSTSSLAAGNHIVTASYGGDTNFAGSTSTSVTVTVQGPPPPVQITDNETITVTDTASFPDVFDPENVKVMDAVTVTPLINVAAPVAEFSAATLGFSGQSGSQTITVSDIGTASLTLASATISGSSQFAITQIACSNSATSFLTMLPSGGACVLTIGYSPSATPSNDNGTLSFADNAALSNLPTVASGSNYAQSIPLSGSGTSTAPPPPPPAVVPVMDNETIHVTDTESFPDVFDPEAVKVTDAVWVTPLIQVAAPVAEFSAGTLGFSGQSGSQTITVSDIGTASLTVSSATISGSSQFAITQIGCSNGATSASTTLPSGGACILTIGYSASATPANDNGTLSFADNAALSNLPTVASGSNYAQSIPLSGSGTSTAPPPPPPAIVPVMDNETIHVTDTPSFPDVFDPEKITVTDQVNIQVLNSTTTSISITGGGVYGTPTSVMVSVGSSTAAVTGNVTLSVDGGAATTLSLTSGLATFNLGVLKAGNHSLSANFATQTNFMGSSAQATLVVNQSVPTITWTNPAAITFGTPLSSTQLNATASISGSFVYSPPASTVLNAGTQTLTATFTPTDSVDYATTMATVTLSVNKATPTVTWANPAPIPYGTALSATQLNATASVSGTFTYNPASGTVLSAGTHILSVTFTPADSTDYNTATATVTITVLNTLVGTGVVVTPVDTTTGLTPVTLNFTNVSTAGVTSLTTGPVGTPPPPGFEVPTPVLYYDISTTATFTGGAQVCFHYANLAFFGSTAPHVFHLEGGVWVDRTTAIDTVNLVACGVVPSLSPFALFAPKPVLTITANNASRQFGAPDPSFSVSYSGFVGTDTPAVLSGTLSCSSTDTVTSPVGTYAINCSGVSSPNYVVRYTAGVLTVTPASTTTSVSVSPSPVKYSDYTALTATVSPTSAGGQTLTGNVQFSLNGGAVGSAVPINSSGVATLSQVQVNVSAGSYPVKAVFTSANANFAGSSGTTTQNVAQENAFILYSGDTIAQVGTTLNLRATVWDSAAAGYPGINPESGPTATIGDITKIWIAFDIYPAGSCGSGTPSTLYAQVALTGTAGIGVAMTALSSSSEVSYCVISRLVAGNTGGTNMFYTAPNAQGAGLDFYVNSGQFATGGGWINDATGSHGNFGFNARYNSTGSPKGQMVYIYRALYNGVLADFIIKSNALTALQFSGTTYPVSSTLQGKANVQINRASDGLSLFSAGNYTFSSTVTDSGQNGTTGKQFSLIVYDSSGVPYHSVLAGTSLQGGNVVVHSH